MSNYSDEDLDKIWQKGFEVAGLDPKDYRTDVANGLMKRNLYGNEGKLGWEVDHIYPKEKLKEKGVPENKWDDMVNIRLMNAKNNAAKGEDYPTYCVAVQYDVSSRTNTEVKGKSRTVDSGVQAKIASAYAKWL